MAPIATWADFVVVVGLCFLFCLIVRYMQRMSNRWHEWMKKRIEKALKLRKLVKDPFRSTNGYSWDYVFVFKVNPVSENLSSIQEEKSLKFILHKLSDAGLQTKLFFSVQNDEIYCKIRCPLKRLLKEADRINYVLNLDPMVLAGSLQAGNMKGPVEKQWKPVVLPNKSVYDPFNTFEPYDFIYCEYRDDNMPDGIYKTWSNDTVLRGVDRLKLIKSIISARLNQGGSFLDIQRLIKDRCLLGYFPLHDAVELRELEGKWLRVCQSPWRQDVDAVKNYFGEKIGLYFLFLGHYTTWLIYASVLGWIAYFGVVATNSPSSPVLPFFCAAIACWSTMFLEYWKRKEKTFAMKWGMIGYEQDEQNRPEYEGELIHNPVDGSQMLFFHHHEYLFRLSISSSVVLVLIIAVLGVIAGIFLLRIILTHTSSLTVGGVAWGGIVTSLVNAIQIQVLNILYLEVAVRLTDYENHRTDTEYEDALISKTFLFQFVNSFSALFYISFFKPFFATVDPCKDSCMLELSGYLQVIFITRLATGALLQICIPYVNEKWRKFSESRGREGSEEEVELSDVELSFFQDEYHVILGPFADFADLAIQFGYTTMFVAAYPLATVMALMNNYLEIRVDAWKLCQLCRRPEPRGQEDIGSWYGILEILSTIAVLVNAGITCFTTDNTSEYSWPIRIWIFITMSGGILLFKMLLAILIPDVPLEVEVQLRRQKHFLDKVLFSIPDENNDELCKINKTNVKYEIRINDDDPL